MSLDINLTGVEKTSNKKTTLTDNSDTFYPTQKAVKTAVDAKLNTPTGTTAQYLRGDGSLETFPTIPDVTGLQSKAVVVSANQTAVNDGNYTVVANATFTDPSPIEGKGYRVFVRNGTATINSVAYTEGTTILRLFHSGAWVSYLGGGSQNLQQVTDNGNTTTNEIKSGASPEISTLSGEQVSSENIDNDTYSYIHSGGFLSLKAGIEESRLFNTNVTNTSVVLEFPNKPTGSYTIATTADIPTVSGLVPYTGATQNVDLGEYELKAGQVEFDQTPTGTAGVAVMRWNDADGTIDLGLKGGNVTLQLGQEQLVRVVNKTATNINLLEANYQAVRVTGAQGQRLKVDLAQATNDVLSAETIGLVTETINNNQEGFITTSGLVRGINTTGSLQGETWADGDVVYLSATTAGRITNVKPSAPNHLVIIGYVVSAHATQGSIFVKVDNGYKLDELHNVAISTPLNNQSLVYETASTLWKNKALTASDVGAPSGSGTSSGTNTGDETQSTILSKLGFFVNNRTTDSTAVTGTTTETIIDSVLIPANTYSASGGILRLYNAKFAKTGTAGTLRVKIYIGPNAGNLTGATLLADSGSLANTILYTEMLRTFTVGSATLKGINSGVIVLSDVISSNSARGSFAWNPAIDNYIHYTVINASAADSTVMIGNSVKNF